MVSSREQSSKSKVTESIEMEYNSDNDSEASFPDCNARGASNNISRTNLLDLERDHERVGNDPRFIEMNNQIRKLTSIVKALADQITSANLTNVRNTPPNRVENTQIAVNPDTFCDFGNIHELAMMGNLGSNDVVQVLVRNRSFPKKQLRACYFYRHFTANQLQSLYKLQSSVMLC